MNLLLVLPIVIPLAAAAVSLVVGRSIAWQRTLAVVGTTALLVAGLALLATLARGEGVAATQIGDWPAPFGITLVADLFSAIMIALAGLMGVVAVVYSLQSIDRPRESFGYYPLLLFLLMGVCGAFLTGDIFNLFVCFEVMLMASFVLMALGGEPAQLRGAIKYVTLNLLASALFLAAVGIVYGVAGTLNMADLAVKFRSNDLQPGKITVLGLLFLAAFGIKAALFPLFFWLPSSYPTPPVAVSAIFAGLLTKVGVYSLIRVFTLLFVAEPQFTHALLLVVAGLTMITGVLGAVAQYEFRRLLSFHIISQIGYMIMGLAIAGLASSHEVKVLALAGVIYFIMHNIVAKTNLFLVSGVAARVGGTFELRELGGLYRSSPVLAILFLISAMSLAGIPPLSGFVGKLALVQAGLAAEQYLLVAAALGVGLLTLFSMTKIWNEAFWKDAPQGDASRGDRSRANLNAASLSLLYAPMIALAAIAVLMGIAAEPLLELMLRAAEQLVDPSQYLRTVQGAVL